MENESEPNEVTNPDAIIETDSNLVLELMRQHAAHIDQLEDRDARKSELMLGMQQEIKLLGSAVAGHQKILEASQPTQEPGPEAPPKPPPLMN
jgi:hypothetical protein